MNKKLLLPILCLGLAACSPTPRDAPPNDPRQVPGTVARLPDAGWARIYRLTDSETGVVCYVTPSSYGDGISCVGPKP